jgi:hypothetical protein
MTNPHFACQPAHMTRSEDILYQTVILTKIKDTVVTGGNSRSILPSVLQDSQSVIQRNRYFGSGNNAN